jgi:hypothetical protein
MAEPVFTSADTRTIVCEYFRNHGWPVGRIASAMFMDPAKVQAILDEAERDRTFFEELSAHVGPPLRLGVDRAKGGA